MKRGSLLFILLLTLIPCGYITYAQGFVATPVEISTEKVNVSGTIFYVHKVLHGQTLYSIAKKYEVSQEEILKHNPSLKDGLKFGQLLYIPVNKADVPVETTIIPAATSASDEVQLRKEKETAPVSDTQAKDIKYKKYTVKWYETLYDVADKFGTSIEALTHLNGLEKDTKLARKQVLLIPDKDYISRITVEAEVVAKPENEFSVTTTEDIKSEDADNAPVFDGINPHLYSTFDRTYLISIVLPFNVSHSTDYASVNQMDFYSGALLALNELKKEHKYAKYKLNLVDLNGYATTWEMLNSGILKGSELIIGPIIEKDLAPVAQYAKENRIPIISPMDTKTITLADDNPYFFLFPSPSETGYKRIVEEMATQEPIPDTIPLKNETYTILYEKGTGNDVATNSVRNGLESKGISYNEFSYGLLEGRGMDLEIKNHLDSLSVNKIFVASESEAFVSDVLRNLHLIQNVSSYNIIVYGQPRWKNYETIELEYFHLLNVHLSMSYFIDYNAPITKRFVKQYWDVFKAEPTPYAFQGHDILDYFITNLERYGREFPVYIINDQANMLQCDIQFTPLRPYSGFINIGTRDITYLPDWKIEYK